MLSKYHYRLLFGVQTLVFIFIIWLQYHWVYEAQNNHKKEFLYQISRILDDLSSSIKLNQKLSALDQNQLESKDIQLLRHHLNKRLQENNINLRFEFGIGTLASDELQLVSNQAYTKSISKSEHRVCLSCIIRIDFVDSLKDSSALRKSFTVKHSLDQMREGFGNKDDDIYFLYVFFPQEAQFIWQKNAFLLILTISLLLIANISFAYTTYSLFRYRKLSQMKDDFIHSLSHEFKTPLSSILLASKTLRLFQMNDKETQLLELIEHDGNKLITQVDHILEVAKMDSGYFQIEQQGVDLNQIILQVIKRLSLLQLHKNADIQLNLYQGQYQILGDAFHLENVIYNLVENALKYAGQSPKIEISTSIQPKQTCHIIIKDDGKGIPKSQHKVVFKRFFRAIDQTNLSGFGLGLYYVRRIIKAHQGKILLKSDLNKGCIFTIILPLQYEYTAD